MHGLSHLAFGNANPRVAQNPKIAAETWAKIVPAICTLDEDRASPFAAKVAARQVGDLNMVAAALTSATIKVEASQGWQLIIPFSGDGTMKSDQTDMAIEGGRQGLLLPNMGRTTSCTTQMIVTAHMAISKLRATASTMIGSDDERLLSDDRPYAIDMRHQQEIFFAFKHLCDLIEVSSP
ncbi:hypothetical protein [Novosphingobium sp.]|uniref:hypothetical protein n=1 Tax=Novosphingobium sp. TaxID=1874826 RepID=UPI0026125B31|nr:hypothetical protein [Novosphingobium sp.]